MNTDNLIPVEYFCSLYEIEFSFISSLEEHGLIEIFVVNDARYLSADRLASIEKMIRLHHDLDINPEGIHAVFQLLDRIENLQSELNAMRNRLNLYEDH